MNKNLLNMKKCPWCRAMQAYPKEYGWCCESVECKGYVVPLEDEASSFMIWRHPNVNGLRTNHEPAMFGFRTVRCLMSDPENGPCQWSMKGGCPVNCSHFTIEVRDFHPDERTAVL